MHLALTLNPFVDSDLLYAQQLGVDWIVGDVPAWDFDTLAAAQNRVKQAGLALSGLASLPPTLLAEALLGQAGREAGLNRVCQIIVNAGKLGIPSLGYGWPLTDPAGVAGTAPGRGESVSTVLRLGGSAPVAQQVSREAAWDALYHFVQRVVPVAVGAGVCLAYRTDIALAALPEGARILGSLSELDRLFEVAGSACHGLDLDQGFATVVLGRQADEVIRHFGRQDRLVAVRMRNLRCTEDGAREHFLDEDRTAALRLLQACREVGFEGPLCPIPSPAMTDDTAWRHKGAAFDIGYLRALLQAVG